MSLPPTLQNIWTDRGERAKAIFMLLDVYELLTIKHQPLIAYGTLLGAVRDSGLIPWDGDFDIVIEDTGEPPDLSSLPYSVFEAGPCEWRVFNPDEGHDTEQGFNWPWVDVSLWKPSGTGAAVWYHLTGEEFYRCPVEDMRPSPVSFEGFTFQGPANPEKHLDVWYPDWRTHYRSPLVNHRWARSHDEQDVVEISEYARAHAGSV